MRKNPHARGVPARRSPKTLSRAEKPTPLRARVISRTNTVFVASWQLERALLASFVLRTSGIGPRKRFTPSRYSCPPLPGRSAFTSPDPTFLQEFRKRRNSETEKEYLKKLTSEICISSTLHHPNVVETVDLLQDENHAWCEVMEFCAGGDLYGAIRQGGMSAAEVECCFKQLLTGLGYLHGQGVAHRDIKPENLLLDFRGQLKVRASDRRSVVLVP